MYTDNTNNEGVPKTPKSTRTMRVGESLTHYGKPYASDENPDKYCVGCDKVIKNNTGFCFRCSKLKEQVDTALLIQQLASAGIIHETTTVRLVSGVVQIVDNSVDEEAREWEELFNAREKQQRSDEASARGWNTSAQQTNDKYCSTCGVQIPTALDICEAYDEFHESIENKVILINPIIV